MHGSSSSSTSNSSSSTSASSQMMMGQYGAVLSPQMQHSAFQFPNSGMSQQADGGCEPRGPSEPSAVPPHGPHTIPHDATGPGQRWLPGPP
ncbi:hypothetical protein KUCAC02_035078 [Chaenocephalus aceratus]|nr:hypothetical protein KUCAC02_035078 [Chaenocephalus aceratus]